MKIVRLQAENVKKLKAVEIKPDGSLVIIGGKNGAGKSSVLDSIAYLLGGKTLCPSEPIRRGEDHAWIFGDLGEFQVERSFTEKGSYLKVTNTEGFEARSPQALLDNLVGPLSFDPLGFAGMEKRQQAETLRALVGLDLREHDTKRAEILAARTEQGRTETYLSAKLAAMPEVEAPDEPVDVEVLMAELKVRRKHNAMNAGLEAELNALVNMLAGHEAEHKELQDELLRLKNKLANSEQSIADTRASIQKRKAELDAFVIQSEREVEKQIEEAGEVNLRIRANKERAKLAGEIAEHEIIIGKRSREIRGMDSKRKKMLSEAKFPVKGLGFDAEGVTFDGLPFDQASQAERLRVSVAIGLAANPKLRIMLIRDGSLLDEANLKMVGEMAEKADAQVWLERVSADGQGCSVFIEDGTVHET